MYRLGKKLLSRAAVAPYQNGIIGRGHFFRDLYTLLHGLGSVDNIAEGVLGVKARLFQLTAQFAFAFTQVLFHLKNQAAADGILHKRYIYFFGKVIVVAEDYHFPIERSRRSKFFRQK